jgi:hypothetical protein
MAGLEELLNAHEGVPDTPAQHRRFMADYLDHLLCHRRLIAYMVSDLAIVAHPVIAAGSAYRRARMQAMLAGDGLDFHEPAR